jgi:hypothetical protein
MVVVVLIYFRFWSIYVDVLIPIFSSSNPVEARKIESYLLKKLIDFPWKVDIIIIM